MGVVGCSGVCPGMIVVWGNAPAIDIGVPLDVGCTDATGLGGATKPAVGALGGTGATTLGRFEPPCGALAFGVRGRGVPPAVGPARVGATVGGVGAAAVRAGLIEEMPTGLPPRTPEPSAVDGPARRISENPAVARGPTRPLVVAPPPPPIAELVGSVAPIGSVLLGCNAEDGGPEPGITPREKPVSEDLWESTSPNSLRSALVGASVYGVTIETAAGAFGTASAILPICRGAST
jgi:hypothetical protein